MRLVTVFTEERLLSMLHIEEVIVVEGKYDKERLRAITDAPIICTHGFELYHSKHMINVIREFAHTRGIIILTDSDRAGFRIRGYLKQCIGKEAKVKHAYIPEIAGKEKRKEQPGKAGLLGVEGMPEKLLKEILEQVTKVEERPGKVQEITKADFYAAGLTGGPQSSQRRAALAKELQLPSKLSANALLEFLNSLYSKTEFQDTVARLFVKDEKI